MGKISYDLETKPLSTGVPKWVTMSEMGVEDGVEYRKLHQYQYLWSDGGRSGSKRPRQSNDCTVRALAVATASGYDDAYDVLKASGRKAARGFDFRSWARNHTFNGFRFIWESFPAVKGEARMNIASFCERYPAGIYIVRISKHVFAVRNGVVYDISELRPDRCVYACWRVEHV